MSAPLQTSLDRDSATWLHGLTSTGAQREAAIRRLHGLLLGAALAEARRRGPLVAIDGAELDDLAHQAASDAVVAILAKLDTFRGESRFTTWAYTFVMFALSSKLGRHFWRRPAVPMDAEDWERLPSRFGFDPDERAESAQLLSALRGAIDSELSARQRRVFVALVLNDVPLEALVIELGSSRNAIYKTLFDARRKLRAALVAGGHMDPENKERRP